MDSTPRRKGKETVKKMNPWQHRVMSDWGQCGGPRRPWSHNNPGQRETGDQELKLASSLLAPPSTHQHRDAGIGFRLRNTSRNGVRSRYGHAAVSCCEVWVRLALLFVRFEQQQQPPPPYLSRFQRDTRVPAAACWLASLQRLTENNTSVMTYHPVRSSGKCKIQADVGRWIAFHSIL